MSVVFTLALYSHGEASGDLVMPKGDNLVEKLMLHSPLELNTEIIHDIFVRLILCYSANFLVY